MTALAKIAGRAGPAVGAKVGLPRVAVLGAGPAGTGAAFVLSRGAQAKVTVLEQRDTVGGNAGSFLLDGIWCDYGSHRFHPVADPRVLGDVKALLGDDLLLRPRHGRILLKQRWIHFPLKPVDLLIHLPMGFTASIGMDWLGKLLPQPPIEEENFATVLRRGVGRTMSENFYYPYVEKLWGISPEDLAVTLAKRRVSASSIGKILRKIAEQIPGLKTKTAGRFLYPRKGFGKICEGFHQAAARHGSGFIFNARVSGICREGEKVTAVRFDREGETHRLPVDYVWSTLPIGLMVRLMDPPAPLPVTEAAERIRFRGMILIYLVLPQDRFSEYDAHYFPERSIPISRMSEPKNYADAKEPVGRTVLCAELPSDPHEEAWSMSDEVLGRRLCAWLASVGLDVAAPPVNVATRRLRQAYPVYDRTYETCFRTIDDWLGGIDGLLTFGRQGLFAHDNTHHALAMAYAACDCLDADGKFDRSRWADHRLEFTSHVVED